MDYNFQCREVIDHNFLIIQLEKMIRNERIP